MDITYEIAKADFDYRATRAREERHPSPPPHPAPHAGPAARSTWSRFPE